MKDNLLNIQGIYKFRILILLYVFFFHHTVLGQMFDTCRPDKVYLATQSISPNPINAKWNKKEWAGITELRINCDMGKIPKYKSIVTAKLMYDPNNLFLIFKVVDNYVRCKTNQINGSVWEDNAVEFFFAPDTCKPLKYFNLEINCAGVALMRLNEKGVSKTLDVNDIRKIKIAHSLKSDFKSEIIGPVTWYLELRLPISVLKKYSTVTIPKSGVIWRANFYKIAHKSTNNHYMSWSFVDEDENNVNMHTPEYFGKIRF